jgi:hypothetical protein
MNRSLVCPHNILLSQRCSRCVVERRVSYSNRLDNLMNLTSYENRLLNYANSIASYRSSLINYIEIQIRDKIISDINYLLSVINLNYRDSNLENIRIFYSNILREINNFNPSTYNIRSNNISLAENLIQENRNILRRRENILDRSSLISQRVNNQTIVPIANTQNTLPTVTRNLNLLSIKDLNKKTKLEVYNEDSEYTNQRCSVCLENFEHNQIIRKLNCNHIFHYTCVDKWFETKHKCPLCRFDLVEFVMV